MSKFYMPLCNKLFVLHTVIIIIIIIIIIMRNQRIQHNGNYFQNETTKIYK